MKTLYKNNAPVKPTKAIDKSVKQKNIKTCPAPLYHIFGAGARKRGQHARN